jgi:hypothetical protein
VEELQAMPHFTFASEKQPDRMQERVTRLPVIILLTLLSFTALGRAEGKLSPLL